MRLTSSLQTELQLPVSQSLALFVKVIRKLSKALEDARRAEITAALRPHPTSNNAVDAEKKAGKAAWQPLSQTVDEELNASGNDAVQALRQQQREVINSLDLET